MPDINPDAIGDKWNQSDPGNIQVVVDLVMNGCANTYGQAPCTASNPAGQECYNCFATCQDQANYTPEDRLIRLGMTSVANQAFAGGAGPLTHIPTIVEFPRQTPTKIKRGDGMAVRGKMQVKCMDVAGAQYNPADPVDKHRATRVDESAGSFWGRFKAQFPYYQRSRAIVTYYRQTDTGLGYDIVRGLEYRISRIDGPDHRGQVVLHFDDILANTSDRDNAIPQADSATLAASINPNATTITITGENPAAWNPGGGYLAIDGEAMSYAAYSAGTLTGVVRGLFNTTRTSHDAGEPVSVAYGFNGWNVVNVLSFLVLSSGIDPAMVPFNNNPADPDEWDYEKEEYLAGHTINHLLVEPRGFDKLIDEICEQCHINLWYDPAVKLVRLSATNTALASQRARWMTDSHNMLAGSLRLRENKDRMISESWAYYDKANALAEDRPASYGSVDIQIDTVLESANAWGEKRIHGIMGSWLSQAGNVAIITNSRTLQERSQPQYELTFQVDGDDPVYTGEYLNIRTDLVQNADGTPQELTWQVLSVKEVIPTARIEVVAGSVRPVVDPAVRFAHIVNVANEGVEYGDATEPDRAAWGWIAAIDGFENDDFPYLMS